MLLMATASATWLVVAVFMAATVLAFLLGLRVASSWTLRERIRAYWAGFLDASEFPRPDADSYSEQDVLTLAGLAEYAAGSPKSPGLDPDGLHTGDPAMHNRGVDLKDYARELRRFLPRFPL
jgi:hypothetical protein